MSGQDMQVDGTSSVPVGATALGLVVPAIVGDVGGYAARRFLEFFAPTIRNRNTPLARFLAWCEQYKLGQLADIAPLHVAAYIEPLGRDYEKPPVKQHLAAIRMLFDRLASGGVLAANPAASVRGPKHVIMRGKTPVLTAEQCRELLDSIDANTLVGLRDRALIAVMTYAFARIGAVVTMRVEDYFPNAQAMAAHESPRTTELHDRTGDEITLDEVGRISI